MFRKLNTRLEEEEEHEKVVNKKKLRIKEYKKFEWVRRLR